MILPSILIQAALDFRNTAPWEMLTDSDLFAVKLTDGETVYCALMDIGDDLSLCYYDGNSGLASYLKVIATDFDSVMEISETFTTFETICCAFVNKFKLHRKGDDKIIENYASAHGMQLKSKLGYPQFDHLFPGSLPARFDKPEYAQRMTDVLRAATYLVQQEDASSPEACGLDSGCEYPNAKGGKKIPLLIPRQNGGYELSTLTLPAVNPVTFPSVPFDLPDATRALCLLPKSGVYQCKNVYLPVAKVPPGETHLPNYPSIVVMVEIKSGAEDYVECNQPNANRRMLLDLVALKFMKAGKRPASIIVSDAWTESLLTEFCQRCNISLRRQKDIARLTDSFAIIASRILNIDRPVTAKEKNARNGSAMTKKPNSQETNGTDPKLHSLYSWKQRVLKYTLTITLNGTDPAIWRKVAVPSNIPLNILGDLILQLMGWENEHLSEFQVGENDFYQPRQQRDQSMEAMPFSRTRRLIQEEYTLRDVLTEENTSILWLYDFGDSWEHNVELSSIDEYDDEEDPKATFIDGKRACPPEDCGGVWGYQQLLELYKKMKAGKRLNDEEKEHYEWFCDKRFNPERLNMDRCIKIVDSYNKK